jgi:hypothetical protein
MNNINSIILLITLLFTSCETQIEEPKNKLTGLWSLVVMDNYNEKTNEWEVWNGGMQGYILYDNKENMSLHLLTKDYEKTALRFPDFDDSIPLEALKHLTNSYVYFAKYSINYEDSVVTHKRISHSNPGEWGKTVHRKFGFIGDTLTLEPLEDKTAGLRLKWVRN